MANKEKHKEAHPIRENKSIFEKKVDFVKENKWFVLGVVIVLLSILVLELVILNPSYSIEKSTDARSLYEGNVALISDQLSLIDSNIASEPSNTIDDDYYNSFKDDYVWLQSKNEAVYHSQPNSLVLPRIAAFTLFLQKIDQINSDFYLDLDSRTQHEEIDYALTTDINYPKLLTDEDINYFFDPGVEQETYRQEVITLFDDYIKSKKDLINSTDSIERKYVEAKKIILISYEG